MPATEQSDETSPPSSPSRTDTDTSSSRDATISEIRASYAEYADRMQRFEWLDRAILGRYRRSQFGDVDGRVLDVACGGGTNVPYLPETVEFVGVDISPEMLHHAEQRLDESALDGTLHEMDAQDLDFPDDSFDAVISALSTCTFPDPVAALREMVRVCRPDGTIRLVEHGRSDVGVVATFQEWRADAHYEKMGCRNTQEPTEVVSEAGLTVETTTTGLLGTITTFEIDPSAGW